MTERNNVIERILLVVLPLCMIFDFGWKLFFRDDGGEWPSPTVTFLDVGFEIWMLICLIWMSVRRLKSTPHPSDGVGAWMVLPVIGLLAGLGLLTLRLNGPSRGELPPRSTETRPVSPRPSAEERELVQKKALALKAPTGFWDARWLMSLEEVKHVRPRVTKDADGDLSESTTWLGRSAKVRYSFEDDLLRLVIVTFRDSATEADFDKTQNHLQSAPGNMTTPSKTEKYLLCSTYEEGGFEITHSLTADKTEQVTFSRSIASSQSSAAAIPPEFQEMSWQMEALLASYKKAETALENTRLSRTVPAGRSEVAKLGAEDLRDYEIKLRDLLNSIDRGIQRLSEPGFAAKLEPFFSMMESRQLKSNWKRSDFDLRRWQLLRQLSSAAHELHKLMVENWPEWCSIESLPPDAEQKPWQKEMTRLSGEFTSANKQLVELAKPTPSPQQQVEKQLKALHVSYKGIWNKLAETRWAQTVNEDPRDGKDFLFAAITPGAVPQLRKLSREDLGDYRRAQRALLESHEQVMSLFQEAQAKGLDPFNPGVDLGGAHWKLATWRTSLKVFTIAYAQTELVEQNWEDWRGHGPEPKGKTKPWQKKAQQLQSEFNTAFEAWQRSR